MNSKVEFIKEVDVNKTPEEIEALSEIKKELDIPETPKEKEFE